MIGSTAAVDSAACADASRACQHRERVVKRLVDRGMLACCGTLCTSTRRSTAATESDTSTTMQAPYRIDQHIHTVESIV